MSEVLVTYRIDREAEEKDLKLGKTKHTAEKEVRHTGMV